jgi:uncharacterized protein
MSGGNQPEIIEAITQGNLERVQKLVKADPPLVNAKTPEGFSLVQLATYSFQPQIANYLIEQGADLNFFEACATNQPKLVARYLNEQPALVNTYGSDGFAPLGLAAFFGHQAVLDELLARGAEVNQISNNEHKVQALHSAAAGLHLGIVKALLEHGAEVNTKQANSSVPLHYAAYDNNLEIVELLLKHGADPTIATDEGETARDMAFKNGHQAVAERLS